MTNQRRGIARGWGLAVLALAACGGGGGDFRTVTAQDVTGIAPGDAQGTAYSGQYGLTVSITGRECDQIKLTTFPTTATVTQNDGRLVVDLTQASVRHLEGAAYADGSFKVGGEATHPFGLTEYVLVEGTLGNGRVEGDVYLTFVWSGGSCRGVGSVSGSRQ